MCTFSVQQDLREFCRAGSVCEDRSEADMAFGVHLGNMKVIFMDTVAESCPRVTEGGRISSFRFCAVAKVPHNKRLNSMFVLSFMTDRVYLLLYLLNEINE